MKQNQQNQKSNLIALDGMSLVLHRTLGRLVTGLEKELSLLRVAAATDFDNVTSTPELAPRTSKSIEKLLDKVENFATDLEALDAHWRALPWSDELAREDPRKQKPKLDRDYVERRLRDALASGPEINPFPEGRETKPTDAAIRSRAEAQAIAEAVEKVMAMEGKPQAEEVAQEATEKETTTTEQELPYVVSGPGPDFDPELLANKRLTKIDIKNDLRDKVTMGNPETECVVGGKPAVWLVAADGTRVVVHSDDFQAVVTTINRAINAGM